MNYADLFPRPITEMTDEEIISRAMELREKNAIVKFSSAKAPKLTKEKAPPKLTKAEQAFAAMEELLNKGIAAKAAREGGNDPKEVNTGIGGDTLS